MNRKQNYIKKIRSDKINLIGRDIYVINQTLIAKDLGISESYVSKLLNGTRHSKKYQKKIQDLIKKAKNDLKAA